MYASVAIERASLAESELSGCLLALSQPARNSGMAAELANNKADAKTNDGFIAASSRVSLGYRLRFGEFPGSVQNLGSRAIEPGHVIPAVHDGQAVGDLAIAAAELDGDRTARFFFRGDIVQGKCVV